MPSSPCHSTCMQRLLSLRQHLKRVARQRHELLLSDSPAHELPGTCLCTRPLFSQRQVMHTGSKMQPSLSSPTLPLGVRGCSKPAAAPDAPAAMSDLSYRLSVIGWLCDVADSRCHATATPARPAPTMAYCFAPEQPHASSMQPRRSMQSGRCQGPVASNDVG